MSELSQSCAHQIHHNQAAFLLCTGQQHARNLFVGEHVVSQRLDVEGTWPSSTLSVKRSGTGMLSRKEREEGEQKGKNEHVVVSHYISSSKGTSNSWHFTGISGRSQIATNQGCDDGILFCGGRAVLAVRFR